MPHETRMRRIYLAAILTAIYLLNISHHLSAQIPLPLPEFFGVYALHNGKLIELSAHPQSETLDFSIGGADILQTLSGTTFPDGNLQFIIFRQSAAGFDKIPALRIASIRDKVELEFSSKRPKKRMPIGRNSWHLTDRGTLLRVAPIPQNPTMMVRAVPEAPLAPGLWAIRIGGAVYDFGIGNNPSAQADCVDRHVHITGVTYEACTEKDHPERDEASPSRPDTTPKETQPASVITNALNNSYSGTAIFPPHTTTLEALFKQSETAIRNAKYKIVESNKNTGNLSAIHSLGSTTYAWVMTFREDPQRGVIVGMTRGTSRRFAPKDIPKLFAYIAEQMKLDLRPIQLTIGTETKPLADWR